MPLYNIRQLIGKTFVLKQPTKFFRVADINKFGDKAKPVSNDLKPGYSFTLDSFLLPTDETVKYGIKYAARRKTYWTFYGANGSYYAIPFSETMFQTQPLKEQGVKTTEQETKEASQANKTAFDNITDGLKNFVDGLGRTGKIVLFVGLGVFAIGYLLEKNKK